MKAHVFFNKIDFDKLYNKEVTPPFKPAVSKADDTFYFDTEFTARTPRGKGGGPSGANVELETFYGVLKLAANCALRSP